MHLKCGYRPFIPGKLFCIVDYLHTNGDNHLYYVHNRVNNCVINIKCLMFFLGADRRLYSLPGKSVTINLLCRLS